MTIKTVRTYDLRKGAMVRLANGWYATIEDNLIGRTTRLATVKGYVTEMGEVYAHDIVAALINGEWVPVEYSDAQIKLRQRVEQVGL